MLHIKATHPLFYINSWGVCFDDRALRIFRNGWFVVEKLFMLFSVYKTV